MATLTQVRNRAAGLLGRHRLGQSINNDLKDRLDEAYNSVYDDLKHDRLVIWSSGVSATIPDKVAPHVAALMAWDATDDIGVSDARMARILSKVSIAKPSIRRNVTPKHESLEDAENY